MKKRQMRNFKSKVSSRQAYNYGKKLILKKYPNWYKQ